VEERTVLDRIEELVAEEHRLWDAEASDRLDEPGHERLAAVRHELGEAYASLRRLRAGQPVEPLRDSEVPEPPNDFDGPDPEPRHTSHGVHEQDSAGGDPSPNAP
jgi:hypothetical protein